MKTGNTSRKRATATRSPLQRDPAQLYRLLVETMNEGLSICDEQDRITYANDSLCRMLGYRREELIGQRSIEFHDQPNRVLLRRRLAERRKGGTETYEIALRKKDGSSLTALISPRPMYDQKGRFRGSFAVISDLTRIKRTEETLRQSEEQLRSYFDNAGDAIYVLEADTGRIRNCNESACRQLGRKREELLQLSARDIEARLKPREIQTAHRGVNSGKARTIEAAHRRKDGSTFPVEIRLSTLDTAPPRMLLAVVRDITERKRAEEERSQLTAVLGTTSDMVATAKADGTVTYLNRAGRQMTGWGEKADVAKFQLKNAHPAWAYRIVRDIGMPQARQKGVWEGETAVLAPEGREIPVSQVIMAHYSENGELLYYSTIIRDITDRKQVEELLKQRIIEESQKEQAARQKTILDAIPDPAWLRDPSGRFLAVNAAWRSFMGVKTDDVAGKDAHNFMPSSQADMTLQEHRRVMRTRKPASREERWEVGGKPLYFDVTRSPIVGADGKSRGTVGIAHDITPKKQATDALRKNEAMLAESQQIAHIGSWEWDIKNNVLIWSDEVYRMFGVSPRTFKPTIEGLANFIHPEDRQFVADSIQKTLNLKAPYDLTHRIILPDGRERVIHEQGRAFYDAKGNPVRTVGTARDITEQRRAEELLRQAHAKITVVQEKERRRLSRELHDSLAQKLVALNLRLKSFKARFAISPDSPQAKGMSELIEQYRLTFDELRHISRELFPPTLELLGLYPALVQLKKEMQSAATRISVRCAADTREARYGLETEIGLYRIAQEAMANAIRHGKPRHIQLSLAHQDGQLTLSVVDDGSGFDAEEIRHGGLGLISMRERTDAMAGVFQVASRPRRTRIKVEVPITKPVEER